jgi:hypothetical protein
VKKLYFFFVLDSDGDADEVCGPYSSLDSAKTAAETDWEPTDGNIFTILVKEGTKFSQVCQAAFPIGTKFPWK